MLCNFADIFHAKKQQHNALKEVAHINKNNRSPLNLTSEIVVFHYFLNCA